MWQCAQRPSGSKRSMYGLNPSEKFPQTCVYLRSAGLGTCWIECEHFSDEVNSLSYHESTTLVCQFLLLGQLIEASMTKSHQYDIGLLRDVHLFCKFGMTFT